MLKSNGSKNCVILSKYFEIESKFIIYLPAAIVRGLSESEFLLRSLLRLSTEELEEVLFTLILAALAKVGRIRC